MHLVGAPRVYFCDHLMNGVNGVSNSLSVYTYDEANKTYKFFGSTKMILRGKYRCK